MNFTWALSEAKDRVLLTIENDGNKADIVMDGHDLDNVILNLANARRQMTPTISPKLDPRPRFRNTVKGGAFHISAGVTPPETKPQVCLATLHPGMGGIAGALSPNEAMELAAHLATKANEVGQQARLVGPDGKPLA